MTRATIAFFDIPYHSRLVTTLPVVRALIGRGHRVCAFTLEPFRDLVAATGAEVVLQPPFRPEPPRCSVNMRTIDYAMHAVSALALQLRALRPALVVFTAKCLWAAIAAELCGIKTAVVHTNVLMPRGAKVSARVHAARCPDQPESAIEWMEARDRIAWAECAAHFGVTRIHADDVHPMINCMNLRGDINLVYASAELQPRREEFDASYHFVGPCVDRRTADQDPTFEAALAALPRPRVFAALGSMSAYNDRQSIFQAVLEALADRRFGAVIAVGAAEVAELRSPPSHVLARSYVPQLTALAGSSVFITHAGTNSVHESLLAGVPMLMLPQGADQPLFAEHMEALGLGHWLGELDCQPAALRRRIEAVLADDAMAERVRIAGDGLRRAGGAERAAALLGDFAERAAAA